MEKLIYPPEGGTYYECSFFINGRTITRLIISNHYKKKHSQYMSDELIKEIIQFALNGKRFIREERKEKWEYFTLEPILYQNSRYKLVWLFHYDTPDFLGVVNCCYSSKKY